MSEKKQGYIPAGNVSTESIPVREESIPFGTTVKASEYFKEKDLIKNGKLYEKYKLKLNEYFQKEYSSNLLNKSFNIVISNKEYNIYESVINEFINEKGKIWKIEHKSKTVYCFIQGYHKYEFRPKCYTDWKWDYYGDNGYYVCENKHNHTYQDPDESQIFCIYKTWNYMTQKRVNIYNELEKNFNDALEKNIGKNKFYFKTLTKDYVMINKFINDNQQEWIFEKCRRNNNFIVKPR
jgi:hypothetical protein